jgi:translocation and assembly module TamA
MKNHLLILVVSILFFILLMALHAIAEGGLKYDVRIEGNLSGSVTSEIRRSSVTYLLKDRPPATLTMLELRAEEDIPNFKKVLRAYGYYGSKVDIRIDSTGSPVIVTFEVHSGPQYRLGEITTRTGEMPDDIELLSRGKLRLDDGKPAIARTILEAGEIYEDLYGRSGFPFAEVNVEAVVYHESRTLDVLIEGRPGPRAVLGDLTIEGNQAVSEETVMNRLTWERGDTYNPDLLSEFRERLVRTGLFATVQVETADSLDSEGALSVLARVREREHRTIMLGVSYKTNEGAGTEVGWEHRNLFRHGDRLDLAFTVAEILLSGEGTLRRADFLRPDLALLFHVLGARERTEAYKSSSLRTSLFIEHTLSRHTVTGGGVSFRISRVEQLQDLEHFDLVSLPAKLALDTRDDLLDPDSGWRLDIEVAPFFDTAGSNTRFWKSYVSTTRYIKFLTHPRSVLAFRAGLGSIHGAPRNAIPADERFYTGGGGSVRGYPYQSVGPMEDDKPVGGRSLLEFSTELRFKLTDSIGMVSFMDGGSAFEEKFPDTREDLLWAWGVGFRYFTSVGPLRVDFAIPVNRRKGIDDAFQVYVSLGQAY